MQISSSLAPLSTSALTSIAKVDKQEETRTQSKWGKSVIVDVNQTNNVPKLGTIDTLRPEWQKILDRLKANPKATNSVIKSVLSEEAKFVSQLTKADNNSSASVSSTTRRQQISKEIEKIKSELQAAAAGANDKNKAAKVKQLMSRLTALSSEMEALPSGDGGVSGMPSFDGAGVANKALDAADQNGGALTSGDGAPSSADQNAAGEATQSAASDPSSANAAQEASQPPAEYLDYKLTHIVKMMQDHTDRSNYIQSQGIEASANGNQEQDNLSADIKDLETKGKKLLEDIERTDLQKKPAA